MFKKSKKTGEASLWETAALPENVRGNNVSNLQKLAKVLIPKYIAN